MLICLIVFVLYCFNALMKQPMELLTLIIVIAITGLIQTK